MNLLRWSRFETFSGLAFLFQILKAVSQRRSIPKGNEVLGTSAGIALPTFQW